MEAIEMSKKIEDWHQWRKKHIGGSEISSIMEVNPWKNAYTLWLEKTGRKEAEEMNFAMRRGLALEEEALKEYVKQTENFIVKQERLEYEKWPIAGANIDGITGDGTTLVEIKCPGKKTIEKCKNRKIDLHYLYQCQWYLMITKAEKCDFFCYDQKETALLTIEPDISLQKELLERAINFWDNNIKNDIAPEVTNKDYIFIDDLDFKNLAEKYFKVEKNFKELEKERKILREKILDFGDDGNFMGDGIKVSINSPRKKVDWEKVCEKYNISEKDLEEFTSYGNFFWTINLQKKII